MRPLRQNWFEWVALAISALAIAAVAGFLVVDALTGGDRPADPAIAIDEADGREGSLGWIVPATVTNAGDEPAEAIVFEATALVGGVEETSQLEVDFLPAGSEVEVEFSFSSQPDGPVQVRLVGSRRP